MNNLVEMLSYPRRAFSPMEELFIHNYIDSISGMMKDSFGNRMIQIGNDVDWCFTSHTDTVHRNSTKKQFVHLDAGYAYKLDGDVLGGDDTTGVWLMLNLIHDNFPGLYIFHRDEEAGGQGSRFIASKSPEVTEGITKLISFDRKGYGDVITHQRGIRCCSYDFAQELARQLGGEYYPSQRGVFSDSANYDYFIPECSNLSIGYFNAHSSKEIQDLIFAEDLFRKLKRVAWDRLPVMRDVNEFDNNYRKPVSRKSKKTKKTKKTKKAKLTKKFGDVTWSYYPNYGWFPEEQEQQKEEKKKEPQSKKQSDVYQQEGFWNIQDFDDLQDSFFDLNRKKGKKKGKDDYDPYDDDYWWW